MLKDFLPGSSNKNFFGRINKKSQRFSEVFFKLKINAKVFSLSYNKLPKRL